MLLKKGSTGLAVVAWQNFLKLMPDGIFGTNTHNKTVAWQKENGLDADGMVGENTFKKAREQGFDYVVKEEYFPPHPNFDSPRLSDVKRMFGSFNWRSINSSEIRILGNWIEENIRTVNIPELIGVRGFPESGNIRLHKLAVNPFLGFIKDAKEANLLKLIDSWAGSFYPRKVRGSSSALSNHSWGTAFDINAWENWLNKTPAKEGQPGTLLRLVPIANKHGFFWGGHYNRRLDGMHFELARI